MEASKLNALVRKRSDMELMPPPPPPKRIKRPKKVLDEETYTDSISHIIARDFYPGLLESQTQQEYLDAVDSKDDEWISSAGRRLAQVMTPGPRGRRGTSLRTSNMLETPTAVDGLDTPMTTRSYASVATAQQTQGEAPDTSLSLGAFQAKYTSEDNESFYKLLDKQNEKRREKYAWMWNGNKLPSKMMIKQREVEQKFIDQGVSLVDDGGERKMLAIRDKDDDRSERKLATKQKPNNEFMFGPEGVEDQLETVAQRAEGASRMAPKQVVCSNTRMAPSATVDAPSAPLSPTLSAIKDAIAGRPRPLGSESGYGGSETPRVNGYAFVEEDEPEPEPLPPPRIVFGKGDATPNPFKIKEQSSREDLHHRMVEKVAQNKRTQSHGGLLGKVDRTPAPKFPSSPRVGEGGMTPAAQRLLGKVGVRTPKRASFGSGTPTGLGSKLNNVRWTPKK